MRSHFRNQRSEALVFVIGCCSIKDSTDVWRQERGAEPTEKNVHKDTHEVELEEPEQSMRVCLNVESRPVSLNNPNGKRYLSIEEDGRCEAINHGMANGFSLAEARSTRALIGGRGSARLV